jgi:hypothetical protein
MATRTTGIKKRKIVRVIYEGKVQYFSSMSAVFQMYTPEQIGASHSSILNYISRGNGVCSTKTCIIEYVPIWVATRSKIDDVAQSEKTT